MRHWNVKPHVSIRNRGSLLPTREDTGGVRRHPYRGGSVHTHHQCSRVNKTRGSCHWPTTAHDEANINPSTPTVCNVLPSNPHIANTPTTFNGPCKYLWMSSRVVFNEHTFLHQIGLQKLSCRTATLGYQHCRR